MTTTLKGKGRLCNQIIRNLCVSILAEKHNLYVIYSNKDLINKLGMYLYSGSNRFNKNIELNDENFFDVYHASSLDANVCPNQAWFQTRTISHFLYDYLRTDDVKRSIMDLNPFKSRYGTNQDIFIHIRLTDTATWNPGLSYYEEALDAIVTDTGLSNANIYIATDQPNHILVRTLLENHVNHAKLLNMNEIETIQYGSTCKYVILSHGSFSAFIGWISFHSEVYYPKYQRASEIWFGDMFSFPHWKDI